MTTDRQQEAVDRFYWLHGPCCAGCDWWRRINLAAGECLRSAPVAAVDRFSMLGTMSASLSAGAGQAVTPRDHWCGEFKDDFDWAALPISYRKRIGAPI